MSLKTNTISSGYSTGLINSNFKQIEDYVNDKLLNRDGVTPGEPNHMEVDLDMNSRDILNVKKMGAQEIDLDGMPIQVLLDNAVEAASQEADRAEQEADRAERAADGAGGGGPGSGGIESIVAGSGIAVDNTDPANPIVSALGGGGGTPITAEQVMQLYESNPNRNPFTDDDVLELAGIQPQIDGINLLLGDVASALDAINGEII